MYAILPLPCDCYWLFSVGPGKGVTVTIVALAGAGISLCFLLALSRYGKSRTIRVAQPALCSTFVVSFGFLLACFGVLSCRVVLCVYCDILFGLFFSGAFFRFVFWFWFGFGSV